jgi:hypothetical protein
MKKSITSALAGASALAIAGTLLAVGGGVASASTLSPFDPPAPVTADGNGATQGTMSLYNAAGNKITSGTLATPPAFAKADTDTGRAGDNIATLYAYTPKEGVVPLSWSGAQISTGSTYPTSSASVPANLRNQPQALTGATGAGFSIFNWFAADGYPADFPNTNTTPAWQNLYQLRLYTTGPGNSLLVGRYSSATIQVNTAAGTWTQVYPEPVAATTSTSLSVSPASPQDSGTPLALSATVTSAGGTPTGSVQFFDGTTSLGSGNVNGSGVASVSNVTLPVGTRSLKAVYTSNAPTQFANSESTPQSFVSNPAPAANTLTALSVNPTNGPAFANVTLTATVTRASNNNPLGSGTGQVRFFDGASQVGQGQVNASGQVQTQSSSFAPGAHSFTAQFIPADSAVFNGSTSSAVTANYDQPACTTCNDPQTVKVTVPAGSLSITTPYTPQNPFDLGTMVLDNNGVFFNASKPFPAASDPSILITDTRAGNLPWNAYVTTEDFVGPGGASIDGAGLSLTNLQPAYYPNNALQAGDVTTTDVPSVKGGPHTFAAATQGAGSVAIRGNLNLQAPSSTPAGLYTTTVTFTIS